MKRYLTAGVLLLALALLGALASSSAQARPRPIPDLYFSPASHDYGSVTLGETASQAFTLSYVGSGSAGPWATSLSGSGSSAFSVTADTCKGKRISAKKSCTITVSYAPSSVGTHYAALVASTNAGAFWTSAALSGTGQAAALPGLSINNPPWVYSNNQANVNFTLTLSAQSASNVTFSWAASDGAAAGDAAIWGTSCDGTADYTSAANTGTGTITAGDTSTTITFGTCNNGPANEYPITTPTYFTVTVSNPVGATITTDTGTGEIRIS